MSSSVVALSKVIRWEVGEESALDRVRLIYLEPISKLFNELDRL